MENVNSNSPISSITPDKPTVPASIKNISKKIIIWSVVVIAIAVSGWFGYKKFTNTNTNTARLYPGKIIIGYVIWPGYLGLYIASDKGYFKDAGLDVEVRAYPSLTEEYNDFNAGTAQGAAILTLDSVNAAYNGLDHKIVVAIDYSNGSDGIISNSDIKKIADVKGKRVAFEHGTLEEFFLRYALDHNYVDFNDIKAIDLNPEKSAEAFVRGEADVAVTYEPFMSKALRERVGQKIYSSHDAPGLITDTLAFRSDFIDKYPETIDAVIKAYFQAIDFWKNNPQEANIIISKYLGVNVAEVSPQVQGVTILDREDNRTAFTFAAGLESLYGNMRSIGDFVVAHSKNKNQKTIDTDSLIDPIFIRKILK